MTFIAALEKELNVTETENGAKAYKSTGEKCLDFFGSGASCRYDTDRAKHLFLLAYNADPETAIRTLFYIRDVRGGQGERDVFRHCFKELILTAPEQASKVLHLIPEYGRWDDLLVVEDTVLWDKFIDIVKNQLAQDFQLMAENKSISLLAKWLPSINTSSKKSQRIGRKIASSLGYNEKQYRKNLSTLRSYLKIVEQKMCSNQWGSIDYEGVPSKASMMYRKAFTKHDFERYSEYLLAVMNGEKKINASTLYPYEIVEKYLYSEEFNDTTINVQWEALPNYMEDCSLNGIVVADVSGSMWGRPLAVSISLALYIAERNNGIWKNKFITFSSDPQLQEVVGSTIADRVKNLQRAEWGYSTNIQKVFDLILQAAINNNISQEEMPQRIIIISDMQFDIANGNEKTNFEAIKQKYQEAGYEMPFLVYWNVYAHANVPMTFDDNGTCLVSGCSPAILKHILSGTFMSPLDYMHQVVYDDRYKAVGTALLSS